MLAQPVVRRTVEGFLRAAPTASAGSGIERLSERERDVLALVGRTR